MKLIGKKIVYFFMIVVFSYSIFLYNFQIYTKAHFFYGSGVGTTRFGNDIDVNAVNHIEYDNYLGYYFSHLNYNLGDNPNAYCVYVGTAMVLSYYDTWWNKNIIEEKYEAKSELKQNLICLTDFITESPGIDSCFRNGAFKENDLIYDLAGNQYLTGAGVYNIESTINEIICSKNNDKRLDCEYYYYDQFIFETIKQQIDWGYPVIVSMGDRFSYGHTVVAFDYYYDEYGEIVLLIHNGYKKDNRYGENGTGYSQYIEIDRSVYIRLATVIKPKGEHVCSDNYVYTDEEGNKTYHCPCELEEHPAHLQKYQHSYTYTAEGHTEICSYNGEIKSETHALDYTENYSDETHTKGCVCGYTVSENHTLLYSGSYGEKTHIVYCACGYEAEREHEYEAYCLNGGWHCIYCPCFGEENEPHYPYYIEVIINGVWYRECVMCGYLEKI